MLVVAQYRRSQRITYNKIDLTMLIDLGAIVLGFALLVWGADRFIMGAAATARNLGVSPLIIGLTIVGFGTSAPEILVSAVASWQGNPGLAVGNAIGSNIANIALILGVTALVMPLRVHSGILRREFPILLAVTLFTLALLLDLELDRIDALLLLTCLVSVLIWMVRTAKRPHAPDPIESEYNEEIPSQLTTSMAITWLLVGLLVLLGSSRLLVWGAVNIATALGVSDLIIGLTIVAIGTSLPELAAAIVSALKKEHDIAIGNIIGSNMFNLLAVLSMPGLIHPLPLETVVLTRDYAIMFGLTMALFVMAYGFKTDGRINRFEGTLLFCAFIGYQYYLYTLSI